jgi:Ni/Co efflux regulator RcnB
MKKTVFSAIVAAAVLAAPLPVLMPSAAAQTTQAAKPAKAKKAPSAGQLAARERQKKCGAEWKEAKAAGKVEKGMTWPKYWSACNKRLKAAAGKG